MMKRLSSIIIALLLPILALQAEQANDSLRTDTTTVKESEPRKENVFKRMFRKFTDIDENYIEPQRYLLTGMLQATYTYDIYTLRCDDSQKQSITFASDGSMKLGPYFGWRWVFAGYMFTLGTNYDKSKTEIDFSFYTSQIGIDLFYRRTGSDYRVRNAKFGDASYTKALQNISFDGVQSGITGLNLYYIFNHRRFSYPAAFAQSTRQRRSCGSWMAGIGYTRNTLSLEYEKLQALIDDKLDTEDIQLDSGLQFKSAAYYDINVSAGYAYNIVFAKNFLVCVGGQLAVSYKESSGRTNGMYKDNRFSFRNIAPNLIGRFAIVYNNSRWYAGFSAIVRSNNYQDERFTANNTFGNTNLYVGYNFGLKKKYRKK